MYLFHSGNRRIAYPIVCMLSALFLSIYSFAQLPLPIMGPLDLLPISVATHSVQNSGNWSDPNTWNTGSVPNNLARIHIPTGKELIVDGEIAERIKIIRNEGKLKFLTTTNTALLVETIVQGISGELEIGTASSPVPAGTTAKITIIDEGDIVLNTDQWEKGLVLMGKTTIYGSSKTSWSELAINPGIGATSIELSTIPIGWNIGDRIVITGTDINDPKSDEVVFIQSISGSTITLDRPLVKDHSTPAPDLFVHAANLDRNVLIESEQSNNIMDRGHIMFMHTLNVDMNFAKVYRMGRSRKDVPIDDWIINEMDQFTNGPRTNIRGRYSIHFHRGGVNQNLSPAYVRGCVVEDDPGWAYTNHSAFVHFDNNVSYDVVGGGFQTEAGDEIGSF
ncbi:MAG: G8 domain-containing protein, partial [Bacteroidota bacterium]